jgi:hypothetical protein
MTDIHEKYPLYSFYLSFKENLEMKKTVIAILLVLLIGTSVSALGIGASFGYDYFYLPGSNAMLSLKLDQYPFIFGVGLAITSSSINFGFTADYWLLNDKLFDIGDINVKWYFGPGLYVGLSDSFFAGVRVPIGLNAFVLKPLELFVELTPTLAIQINPLYFPKFGIGSNIGFRFWL